MKGIYGLTRPTKVALRRVILLHIDYGQRPFNELKEQIESASVDQIIQYGNKYYSKYK